MRKKSYGIADGLIGVLFDGRPGGLLTVAHLYVRPPIPRAMLAIVIVGLFLGCSTLKKTLSLSDDPTTRTVGAAPSTYLKGVRLLEKDDFKGALESFDEFLAAQPATPYTQVAIFNSARAQEGLGQWDQAGEKYQAVVRSTNRAPKLQALALYRLSFCHEARGRDPQTVAALIDARNRIHDLPDEIGAAELPARLAAAYARIGNPSEALKYYVQAEGGVARLRARTTAGQTPEWLPRTLYQMGRMSIRSVSWDGFEEALRPIGKAQVYLIQAAELDSGIWSAKAADEIIKIYSEIWDVLQTEPSATDPSADPIIETRAVQRRQWEMAELTIEKLRELRSTQMPEEKARSENLSRVFQYVDSLESRLTGLLQTPLAGDDLTPDAKARRDRVRGRVVTPTSDLERNYLRTKKESATRLPTKKSDAQPAEPGDPNL